MITKLGPLLQYLDSCNAPASLEVLGRLLRELEITRDELKEYCQFGTETYRRNPISRSQWYELLAICWRSGHSSPIHDHAGSSCAFRILEGVAAETNFELTGPGRVKKAGEKSYPSGEICLSTSEHIHRVWNPQPPGLDLITLHIYSPPLHMGLYRLDPAFEERA